MIKKIQHSLKSSIDVEGKKNGFIITGSPGSGKTAFLTELCFPEWDKIQVQRVNYTTLLLRVVRIDT